MSYWICIVQDICPISVQMKVSPCCTKMSVWLYLWMYLAALEIQINVKHILHNFTHIMSSIQTLRCTLHMSTEAHSHTLTHRWKNFCTDQNKHLKCKILMHTIQQPKLTTIFINQELGFSTHQKLPSQPQHTDSNTSRVSNQNGVSLLYIMLEIHHSGREPLTCTSNL